MQFTCLRIDLIRQLDQHARNQFGWNVEFKAKSNMHTHIESYSKFKFLCWFTFVAFNSMWYTQRDRESSICKAFYHHFTMNRQIIFNAEFIKAKCEWCFHCEYFDAIEFRKLMSIEYIFQCVTTDEQWEKHLENKTIFFIDECTNFFSIYKRRKKQTKIFSDIDIVSSLKLMMTSNLFIEPNRELDDFISK